MYSHLTAAVAAERTLDDVRRARRHSQRTHAASSPGTHPPAAVEAVDAGQSGSGRRGRRLWWPRSVAARRAARA